MNQANNLLMPSIYKFIKSKEKGSKTHNRNDIAKMRYCMQKTSPKNIPIIPHLYNLQTWK